MGKWGTGVAERSCPARTTLLSIDWPGGPGVLLCNPFHPRKLAGCHFKTINPASWSPLTSGLLAQDNLKVLGDPVFQMWTML